MAQQGGLTRAEEAGNDGDGEFGQCFHRMPFGAGIRDDRPCDGAQQRISSPDHPARLSRKSVARQVSWLGACESDDPRWLRLPAVMAVAWQSAEPFTVAGAAAAWTAFPS
jgi:hypothetical protein